MRMVGRDDFLGHQAPMGNRSHRVAVIVQAIANIAFVTVHGTMGITHQPELGRTSGESNRFRMHPDDYVTSLSSSHSFDSAGSVLICILVLSLLCVPGWHVGWGEAVLVAGNPLIAK